MFNKQKELENIYENHLNAYVARKKLTDILLVANTTDSSELEAAETQDLTQLETSVEQSCKNVKHCCQTILHYLAQRQNIRPHVTWENEKWQKVLHCFEAFCEVAEVKMRINWSHKMKNHKQKPLIEKIMNVKLVELAKLEVKDKILFF
ncbi:hypothetical protein RFI_03526 [Reticulomyxa filosa]|uniref:Uncharacterized protein n=1 Tax=Reticulomyxa filosa TaxID=46433 RepID=X6P7G3_RETFI|nr:hypothetical protein RFI_03526 [Reticulomyxa filosa]|eukprot:ETO33577.1 hypothetical protein RFI_03526 [Reticulomyxa filosa]